MENRCFIRKKGGIYQTFCLTSAYNAIIDNICANKKICKSKKMTEKKLKILAIFDHLFVGENKKKLSILCVLLLVPSFFLFPLFSIKNNYSGLIKTEIKEKDKSFGVYMLRENIEKDEVLSLVKSRKEKKAPICAELAENVCQKSFVRKIIYIDRF